jgi:hypothetical protein
MRFVVEPGDALDALAGLFLAMIRNNDGCAQMSQPVRNSRPNPAATACHDGNLTIEAKHPVEGVAIRVIYG